MEITFHGHHSPMSPRLQRRAREGVAKLAKRLGHPVDATIRFEEDGPTRRVEIMLHAPRRKAIVAEAGGRYTGSALTEALERLRTQINAVRRKRLARRTGHA